MEAIKNTQRMHNALINIALINLAIVILLLIISVIELFFVPIFPITNVTKIFFDITAPILMLGLWVMSFVCLLVANTVYVRRTNGGK